MKRKIAILLSAVMTSTVLPMTSFAATSKAPALIGGKVVAKEGEKIQESPVKSTQGSALKSELLQREGILKMEFDSDDTATINKGDSFIIRLENATFPEVDADGFTNKFGYVNVKAGADANAAKVTAKEVTQTTLEDFMETDLSVQDWDSNSAAKPTVLPLGHIPYEIEKLSADTAKVTFLVNVSNDSIKDYYGDDIQNVEERYKIAKPFLAIPLGEVIADGEGDIKVNVDSMGNARIKDGSVTVASVVNSAAKTEVIAPKTVKVFDDKTIIDNILVKEIVKGSLKNGTTINLRLNGGFEFKSATVAGILKDGGNSGIPTAGLEINTDKDNSSKASVELKNLADASKLRNLIITGLEIQPTHDKNYGDVELTISGEGITEKTITVAKREQLGFKLEVLEDPTEIIAGRYFTNDSSNMVEKDNLSAKFRFSENVENTLVSSRNLEFTVPEGVKVVNAVIESKNFGTDKPEKADFDITDNGRTLRLNRGTYETLNNKKASLDMKLYLSVDPSFSGDIQLGVSGGGQSDETPKVVIAKAITPFTIQSNSTKLNMGYQDYNTADIVITETKPGMFLEGKDATLTIKAPYGTSELGFSNAKYEVSGGELEIRDKEFKVNKGSLEFKVNKSSYKNPATLTIKDVKIGTTRSVPYGSYKIALGGDAIINNYNADIKTDKIAKLGSEESVVNQDNNSSYGFDDYVKVVTETGTLDYTVKVTVGEKTALVGDKAVDMQVAPYIQATSNSTMVPLRFVSIALGVDTNNLENADASSKVSWDANSKTTTIYYGAGTSQKIIQFQANSNKMMVDGTAIPMEFGVVAEIKDGRMFVPFRALGQALGVSVSWDADTRTAIYNESNGRNNVSANVITNATTTTAATTTETTTETTTATTK